MKPAAGLSILVAAMLVSLELLASLSPSRALADELPKDTNQIESLTPEQAKTLLAEFTGRSNYLQLDGLTALDADTAKRLAEFKGDYLTLSALTTLDADTAKALAEFKGDYLTLKGLTTLDAATAKTLAEFNGILELNGVTALDAATAEALAGFKGRTPWLNVLAAVDLGDTGFVQLPRQRVRLYLYGLTTLDAATAKVLAESKVWDGQLPNITAFESPDSVEIATALAKRKGPLSLPNLAKISPKTLTALIEKEDVEIPLIETLELIQEPDGSPTDDFMIPKGFQSRQKARQQGR